MLFKSRGRWISGERIKTVASSWAKKITNTIRNLGIQPKAVPYPSTAVIGCKLHVKKKYPIHTQQCKVPGSEKHIRHFPMTTRKKTIGCNSIWQNWKHVQPDVKRTTGSLLPLEQVTLLGLKLVFYLPYVSLLTVASSEQQQKQDLFLCCCFFIPQAFQFTNMFTLWSPLSKTVMFGRYFSS